MNVSLFIGMRYTGTRRRNQLVSFISRICIVGLVVSVALLVTILSVMNGFDKEFRERMLAVIPQVTVLHREGLDDWQSLRQSLLQVPSVIDVAPYVELGGMMFVDQRNVQPVVLYGIDPEYEVNVSAFENYLGDLSLQSLTANSDLRGVFLGKGLAENLKVEKGSAIKIIVPPKEYGGLTVLGTFDTGTEVDNAFAITTIPIAQNLSSRPERISGLRLKIDDIFLAPSLSRYISSNVLTDFGYYTNDWTRSHSNLYYAIRQSKELVGLLLVLIIGIAAFNLVSTLYMVVVDKRGDIAILRTLGASTKKIMAVFMVQGTLIGLIGTGIGLLIGVPLAYQIEAIVQTLESWFGFQLLKSDSYPISFVPSDPLLADIVYVSVTALVLSLIATLYPAWRASRVKPAEALRFEF